MMNRQAGKTPKPDKQPADWPQANMDSKPIYDRISLDRLLDIMTERGMFFTRLGKKLPVRAVLRDFLGFMAEYDGRCYRSSRTGALMLRIRIPKE